MNTSIPRTGVDMVAIVTRANAMMAVVTRLRWRMGIIIIIIMLLCGLYVSISSLDGAVGVN